MLRPFRTVLWVLLALAIGYVIRILWADTILSLEVAILVSSLVANVLAVHALVDSFGDYRHEWLSRNVNGKREVADEEVGQDAVRVAASLTSWIAALWVLWVHPNASSFGRVEGVWRESTLVAEHAWLFLMWFLLAATLRERLSRWKLRRRSREVKNGPFALAADQMPPLQSRH